jgi:hypothetical protein
MRGTLNANEYHPAADSAKHYLASLGWADLCIWQESFASCAIEGNRLAEICSETLHRLMGGEPVSDRYILGLAFTIQSNLIKKAADAKKDKRKKR